METNKKIHHFHIPKTAGTTLRYEFCKQFGAKNVFYFDPHTGRASPSNTRLLATELPAIDSMKNIVNKHSLHRSLQPIIFAMKSLQRITSSKPENVKDNPHRVLTGHFTYEDLTSWGIEPEVSVSVIRDPLQRAWSHFKHWKRSKGNFPLPNEIPYTPDFSFESFISTPDLINYQSRWIGRQSLTHIGVSEQLDKLLEEVGITPSDPVKHLNSDYGLSIPEISSLALKKFKANNEADYALYESAAKKW